MLEVTSAFNVTLHVPQLKSEETKRVLLQTESFSPAEVYRPWPPPCPSRAYIS
jgi:hypothetical protein